MKLRLLTAFFVAACTLKVSGQSGRTVSGTFRQMQFDVFVETIEKNTGYRFFYDPTTTDSVIVDAVADNLAVADLLEQVLNDTDLRASIDLEGNVFITRNRLIMVELPAGFTTPTEDRVSAKTPFDFSAYERRAQMQQTEEEKIHFIGRRTTDLRGSATIAGSVRNSQSGEPVIGALVFVAKEGLGISTDQFGYYALTLPKGKHELGVRSIGMKETKRIIMLYEDGRLDIDLDEVVTPLKEVVIESEHDVRVTGLQMGREKLDIKTMKQIPLALGETDIMKVVLTLPGVQTVGEGTVGLNVRGGATNQNLLLFNDAMVYNPSHMFGFFSTFNPDVLKNVELFKSGIGAEYGGRISAVLDVQTREGNTKEITGSGGISPITGRFTLEGPIIKDRTSFIVGVRSTYSNWLLRQVDARELRNSNASFYDVTANLTHKLNDDNSLYFSGYMSRDRFRLHSDTLYGYGDRNATFKWKRVINSKLYGVFTTGISSYTYDVSSNEVPENAFDMDFSIRQFNTRVDLSWFRDARHTINAGIGTTRYRLQPGTMRPAGPESLVAPLTIQHEQGQESALYISQTFEVTPELSFYAGLRYSFFQNVGPQDVYLYPEDAPKRNASDTVRYGRGRTIATYHGAEPRLSLRYSLTPNASVKLSYNRMRQYLQMLSNTTAITPTDVWKLSDLHMLPLIGDQWSLGFYKNMRGSIETSVEGYYKLMKNVVDYRGGAQLILNDNIETELLNGDGRAYGVEFLLKRTAGKLNGWITYTWSRSLQRIRGAHAEDQVNNGKWFPSNFDKPHAVNFIGNYKFSRRFNFSLNVVYSTGRPITLPVQVYEINGARRVLYSDRNAYRIPDYLRTDISINLEGNHKVRKLAHSSWTFAVYNFLGRANPYSIFFVTEGERIQGYKLSVFARPIPTITYNFKF